jgi:hypothetical protein
VRQVGECRDARKAPLQLSTTLRRPSCNEDSHLFPISFLVRPIAPVRTTRGRDHGGTNATAREQEKPAMLCYATTCCVCVQLFEIMRGATERLLVRNHCDARNYVTAHLIVAWSSSATGAAGHPRMAGPSFFRGRQLTYWGWGTVFTLTSDTEKSKLIHKIVLMSDAMESSNDVAWARPVRARLRVWS